MVKKLEKVPALEYFRYDSKTSLNPSPLTESSSGQDQQPTESALRTAESAVYALEQKSEKTSNISLFARPKLEKIGAVGSQDMNANKLKTQFTQLSKHFEKSGSMLLETQKTFEEWSATFESEEVERLSKEIGQCLQLHDLINKSFAQRFDNIAFKLKPLVKQEFKRDTDLAKLVKSRRDKEELSKRCRDQSMITDLENKVEERYQAVRTSQTILEKRVREDLRPSLFSYAYIMKNSAKAIENLLETSSLDMQGFDGVLTNKGEMFQAQLNFSKQGLMLNTDLVLNNSKFQSSPKRSLKPPVKNETIYQNINVSQESIKTGNSEYDIDILNAYENNSGDAPLQEFNNNETLKTLHISKNNVLVQRDIPNEKNCFSVKDNYHKFAESSIKHQNANIDVGFDNSNTWAKK